MGKLIKIIGSLIGLLILLVIIAVVILVTVINPNDFKKQISQYVQKETGHELIIAGNISWSFFPWVGLKVNDVTLNSSPNFQNTPFLSVKEADCKIKFMPLLRGKIQMNHISLEDLDLNLVKNNVGQTNWAIAAAKPQPDSSPATTTQITAKPSSNASIELNIAEISVSNAKIQWTDQQSKQQFTFTNTDLTSKNFNFGEPFPLQFQSRILSSDPKLDANVNLSALLTLDTKQNRYNFQTINLKFTDNTIPNKQANTSTLQGSVAIELPTSSVSQQTNFLNTAKMNGDISFRDLFTHKLHFQDVRATITGQDGIIKISPFTAKLYGGTSQGNITANFTRNIPSYAISETVTGVQLQPLLQALSNNNKISGSGNLNLNVTTAGNTPQQMKSNLNGVAKFSVLNGIYHGINIDYQLTRAYAFFKQQTLPETSTNEQTQFRNLSGSAQIKNGIAYNNDLLIQSQSFQVTGEGTANLNNEKLDFKLKARGIREQAGSKALEERQTVIPLILVGTFDSPKLLPDFKELGKTLIQQEVKGRLQDAVEKSIGNSKGIGKDLGESIKKAVPIDRLFGN